MRKKSALLIILMVFLSQNHSPLEGSIIPQLTFARIFTLCNSIFTPIKTRLARIGSIFSNIWHTKQSTVNMEEVGPIEHELITFNAPEQSEYENLQQQLKKKKEELSSILDVHTEKAQKTLTQSTIFGCGSLAALQGLGQTPIPQLVAHYTRFKLASLLPILNYAYPFAIPVVTLLIGGAITWKGHRTMRKQRKNLEEILNATTISFDEKLTRLKTSCLANQAHPQCNEQINALNVKLNMKFQELSQMLENLSNQTRSVLSNLEEPTYQPDNIVDEMKKQLGELCQEMSTAKKKQEEVNEDVLGYFPQLRKLPQLPHPEGESSGT